MPYQHLGATSPADRHTIWLDRLDNARLHIFRTKKRKIRLDYVEPGVHIGVRYRSEARVYS